MIVCLRSFEADGALLLGDGVAKMATKTFVEAKPYQPCKAVARRVVRLVTRFLKMIFCGHARCAQLQNCFHCFVGCVENTNGRRPLGHDGNPICPWLIQVPGNAQLSFEVIS